uniref:C-type lectin domain family 12 member B n=1 Tax=Jaculus jaculus TaxID=51337 RepID=UPI001E1B0E47|nr:C-type lectin domain family 12 member B [Jaculus jaculus]
MSDQVSYATLTFQDPAGARNNQDGNNLRKRGHLAPARLWRRAALGTLVLCLLLLTGLVTAGVMVLQMSKEINSDSEQLKWLQETFHQKQDNLSEQLSNCRKAPTGEEFLKAQIAELLQRQQEMATELCKDLVTHTSDHKCNPCPKTWQWYQHSCYHFTTGEGKAWSDSRKDCADQNATLVKIDSMREKDFLQSQPLSSLAFFWLGLSRNPSHHQSWLWEDGSMPSPSIAEISWICEKTAPLVKIEDLY